MRNIFILLFTFMAFALSAQTTLDEYNYVTKGYKIQQESGLDMKRGYHLVGLINTEYNDAFANRKIALYGLVRDGDTKMCAMMVKYQVNTASPIYMCIPTYNADQSLWKMTNDEIVNTVNSQALSWILMQYIAITQMQSK